MLTYFFNIRNGHIFKKNSLVLILLFLLGLGIRVAYIENTEVTNPLTADAREYVIYGYNLVNHHTYSREYPSESPTPDSFRSPGFPLLIALSYMLGGENYFTYVYYSQAFLGSCLILITYCIGTCFIPSGWALVAAGLVCISPHLISMTAYLLTETLFGFFLLCGIFSFYAALQRQSVVIFSISGFFFGAAYITNETALFIPCLIAQQF